MSTGALFWFIIFSVAALLFFCVAAVVTVKGLKDLKSLLRFSEEVQK